MAIVAEPDGHRETAREPILDMRAYQREWIARRRADWFAANGPCVRCGSWDQLELDHVDPETKVTHRIWSWAAARRDAELAKCQVLCHDCHLKKTYGETVGQWGHGDMRRYRAGCHCDECRATYNQVRRERRVRAFESLLASRRGKRGRP